MLETYCIEGIQIDILLFCCLCAISLRNKWVITKGAHPMTHVIVLLFCIFAFWSQDYYGYLDILRSFDIRFSSSEQKTHLEPLYTWIAYLVKGNYTLFRLCIWGASYMLFLKTLQNLGIYNKQAIALFIVYFLLIFSYSRVSLGMVSLFYGISLILRSNKHLILNMFLGFAMLLLAYNAHKSMFVAVAIFPFIFIRLNKTSFLIFIIAAILFASFYGKEFISYILGANINNNNYVEFIQESAANYYTLNLADSGVASTILSLIQIVTLTVPIIYCYTNTSAYKYLASNSILRYFVNYSTILMLIGVGLGLVLSFNSPISYRLMFMAYIPNIIILCTLYKNQILSRSTYNMFFTLFALFSILRLSYALYISSIAINI